jgi:hypothetical protein
MIGTGGKPKYPEINLFHCHFVEHKSSMDWPGIEPETPRWIVVSWVMEPYGPVGGYQRYVRVGLSPQNIVRGPARNRGINK